MWRFINRFPAVTVGVLFVPAFLAAGYGYYGTAAALYGALFWIGLNRDYPPGKQWRRWVGCSLIGLLVLVLLYSLVNPPAPLFG
jgi:hypothetical protein